LGTKGPLGPILFILLFNCIYIWIYLFANFVITISSKSPVFIYFNSLFILYFFNIKQNIPPGLPIKEAIIQAKKQNGKVLLYDLSRRAVRAIADWKSTSYEPDFVEIYNAKSKGYHDVDVDYPRVISSAAKSGAELEKIPVYTEMSRKQLVDFGFLQENEGEEFTPGYLLPKKGEENYG